MTEPEPTPRDAPAGSQTSPEGNLQAGATANRPGIVARLIGFILALFGIRRNSASNTMSSSSPQDPSMTGSSDPRSTPSKQPDDRTPDKAPTSQEASTSPAREGDAAPTADAASESNGDAQAGVQAFKTKRTKPREALYHVVTRPVPWSYGRDRITAIPRDPDICFIYWEVTDDGIEAAKQRLGDAAKGHLRHVLRIYDTTGIDFDGTNAHSYYDIDVSREARSYYLNPGRPGSAVTVEIGLLSEEGYFQPVARSGQAYMPRAGLAADNGVEWLTVDPDPVTKAKAQFESRFGEKSTTATRSTKNHQGEPEPSIDGVYSEEILARLLGGRDPKRLIITAEGSKYRVRELPLAERGPEQAERPGSAEMFGASEHLGASEHFPGASDVIGGSEQVFRKRDENDPRGE